MTGLMKKAGLGFAMAATVLATAAPADAQRWRRYDRGRGGGDVAAGAIIGGILGLGVGAAIANGNRGRYDGYYDRGYNYRGYYDRGYYDAPPRAYYYNDDYRYQQRCWNEWRRDPYYGGRVQVQVCG